MTFLWRCLAALTLAINFSVSAGSLAVSPLRLTFSNAVSIVAITVENPGTEEILVQTEVFTWRQAGGEHGLSSTDDLIAMPPVFKLAPGAKQMVRVGLVRSFVEPREQTFRLIIAEVPTVVTPGSVTVAVRHSLPIFVRPPVLVAPSLVVKRGKSATLEVENTGSAHTRISRWRLLDSNGTLLAEASGPGYLLAGASQTLTISDLKAGDAAIFETESDAGTQRIFLVP